MLSAHARSCASRRLMRVAVWLLHSGKRGTKCASRPVPKTPRYRTSRVPPPALDPSGVQPESPTECDALPLEQPASVSFRTAHTRTRAPLAAAPGRLDLRTAGGARRHGPPLPCGYTLPLLPQEHKRLVKLRQARRSHPSSRLAWHVAVARASRRHAGRIRTPLHPTRRGVCVTAQLSLHSLCFQCGPSESESGVSSQSSAHGLVPPAAFPWQEEEEKERTNQANETALRAIGPIGQPRRPKPPAAASGVGRPEDPSTSAPTGPSVSLPLMLRAAGRCRPVIDR
jgi:hypothetical protein